MAATSPECDDEDSGKSELELAVMLLNEDGSPPTAALLKHSGHSCV